MDATTTPIFVIDEQRILAYETEILNLKAELETKTAELAKMKLKTHDAEIEAFQAVLHSDYKYEISQKDNTLRFVRRGLHFSAVSRKPQTPGVFLFVETRGMRWCAQYEITCEIKDLQTFISYIQTAYFDVVFKKNRPEVPGIKVISTEVSTLGN
jgi:hypothetical protein